MISDDDLRLIENDILDGKDLKNLAARVLISEVKDLRKDVKSLCVNLQDSVSLLETLNKTFLPKNVSLSVYRICDKLQDRIDKHSKTEFLHE